MTQNTETKRQTPNLKAADQLSSSLSSSVLKLESDFDDILSRMKTACRVGTDKLLADILEVQYSTITTARRRGALPPAWLLAVADKTGASVDWLRSGEGEMMRGASAPERPAWESPEKTGLYNGKDTLTCFDCELMMIPLVEARLSAGNGSFETSADSERRYAFRTDFLCRKGNASAMVLMRVAGDSMEPDIKDNDVVLVDTANTTPLPGRLYAVAVQDLVYLKMVDASPDKLILSSANPAYAPLEIDARADLHDGIRIIGRAVWVGRELD